MKTFKTLTVFIIVILVSVLACKKASETPIPIPTVNPTDQLFSDNILAAVQEHTVDVSTWTTIEGDLGSMILVTPTSFKHENGDLVTTGNVDIELIEALDNTDMLMLNRQTMTNNGKILNSGGIIYINASLTSNGEQLQIANPLVTTVPVPADNLQSNMTLFSGDTTANGDFVWTEIDSSWVEAVDSSGGGAAGGDGGPSYSFMIDSVGWTNIDQIDGDAPYTEGVDVVLPSGHDGGNSVVFMYFTSINSVANLNDYANPPSNTFSMGSWYQMSTGYTLQFVVVSEKDNQWSYHVTDPKEVEDPHIENIPDLTLADPNTEQAVQDAIRNALDI